MSDLLPRLKLNKSDIISKKVLIHPIHNQRSLYHNTRPQFCVLLFVVASVFILCIVQYNYIQIDIISYANNWNTKNAFNTSCLNKIYDEIFVISSPNRHKTLSVSLFQLNQENIVYTLWECHTQTNPYSMKLFHKFRQKVNASNDRFLHRHKTDIGTSAYQNPNVFLLRQTQIDLLKHARNKNLSKILIFEDDILLANPEWFEMFCCVESSIPNHYILNIGVNQHKAYHFRNNSNGLLLDIQKHENKTMKYFIRTTKNFGTFAVAISNKLYSTLIDLFDVDSKHHLITYPIDNYMRFVDENIRSKSFNIHPNLVLPDVTTSSIRSNKHQRYFIHIQTSDGDETHYTKYWNLRFSDNKSLTLTLQQQIANFSPTFHQIMKRQRKNPSFKYVHPLQSL